MRRIIHLAAPLLFLAAGLHAASILPDDAPKSQFAPGWEKYQQGVTEIEKGQLKEAEQSLKASLALDPRRPGAYVGLGQIAFKLGRKEDAHDFFDKALMEAPDDYGVLMSYARIRTAEKNLTAAENLLRRAMQSNRKATEPYVYLGNIYADFNHQPSDALKLYQQAIAIDVNSGPAHYLSGLAYLEMKQPEAAITELDKAAKLANGDAIPATRLGAVLIDQKSYSRAIEAFNQAIKTQPSFAMAYVGRGDAYTLRNDLQSALRDYLSAIRIAPENANAHLRLALHYHTTNQLSDAREQYLKVISIDKKLAVAYNNIAALEGDRKQNFDQAITWAKTAVDLAPGIIEYADTLAWIYHQKGENYKAQTILRGIASRSNNADIQYHAGVVMQEMGDTNGARSAYQAALRIDSAFSTAEDAKKRLAALAGK